MLPEHAQPHSTVANAIDRMEECREDGFRVTAEDREWLADRFSEISDHFSEISSEIRGPSS